MRNRPVLVIITSVMFILTGGIGIASDIKELSESHIKLYEIIWVLLIHLSAIVCGLLLLMRMEWARWLAVAWMLYHIVLSAFHSTTEMIIHILLFIIVCVFLYLPASAAYFKIKAGN